MGCWCGFSGSPVPELASSWSLHPSFCSCECWSSSHYFCFQSRKKEELGHAYQLHVSLFIKEESFPRIPSSRSLLHLGPGGKKKLRKYIFVYTNNRNVVGGIMLEESRTWLLGIPINKACLLTMGSQEGDSNSEGEVEALKSMVVTVVGHGQGQSRRQESSHTNGSKEIESKLISAKVRRIIWNIKALWAFKPFPGSLGIISYLFTHQHLTKYLAWYLVYSRLSMIVKYLWINKSFITMMR